MTRTRMLDGNRKRLALVLLSIFHLGWLLYVTKEPVPWTPDDAVLHYWFPRWLRVLGWGIPAVVGLVVAWRQRLMPLGWALLIVMPVQRTVSYAWSTLMWIVPGWPPGDPMNFANMLIWGTVAVLIWTVSTWPEYEHT